MIFSHYYICSAATLTPWRYTCEKQRNDDPCFHCDEYMPTVRVEHDIFVAAASAPPQSPYCVSFVASPTPTTANSATWRKHFGLSDAPFPHGDPDAPGEMQNYDPSAPTYYDGTDPYVSKTYGGGYYEGDFGPEEVKLEPQSCHRGGHSIAEYVGFTETYKYCRVCDMKNPPENDFPTVGDSDGEYWL